MGQLPRCEWSFLLSASKGLKCYILQCILMLKQPWVWTASVGPKADIFTLFTEGFFLPALLAPVGHLFLQGESPGVPGEGGFPPLTWERPQTGLCEPSGRVTFPTPLSVPG